MSTARWILISPFRALMGLHAIIDILLFQLPRALWRLILPVHWFLHVMERLEVSTNNTIEQFYAALLKLG